MRSVVRVLSVAIAIGVALLSGGGVFAQERAEGEREELLGNFGVGESIVQTQTPVGPAFAVVIACDPAERTLTVLVVNAGIDEIASPLVWTLTIGEDDQFFVPGAGGGGFLLRLGSVDPSTCRGELFGLDASG